MKKFFFVAALFLVGLVACQKEEVMTPPAKTDIIGTWVSTNPVTTLTFSDQTFTWNITDSQGNISEITGEWASTINHACQYSGCDYPAVNLSASGLDVNVRYINKNGEQSLRVHFNSSLNEFSSGNYLVLVKE